MGSKKAPKIEAQVVEAIRRLQAVQGSTPREISNYISQEYNIPGPEIRRQIQVALKRGVTYGILQRVKGGCYTYNPEFPSGHPMYTGDSGPGIPCHRRRGRRRSRRRSGRRRGKSRRRSRRRSRRGKSRRGRRRKRRRAEVPNENDGLEIETTVAKQPKRSSSPLRKDSPQDDDSSISGCSEEKQE